MAESDDEEVRWRRQKRIPGRAAAACARLIGERPRVEAVNVVHVHSDHANEF